MQYNSEPLWGQRMVKEKILQARITNRAGYKHKIIKEGIWSYSRGDFISPKSVESCCYRVNLQHEVYKHLHPGPVGDCDRLYSNYPPTQYQT